MYAVWFCKPVSVGTNVAGDIRNRTSARHAFDLLTEQRSSGGTNKYRPALRAWQHALNVNLPADIVREVLIKAAGSGHVGRLICAWTRDNAASRS
ncbi:DUF982 domain-containing protein, partial [Rhizobium sp. 2YAF20]|uniref:DUF982 domain-containing protein n=1 Tax=Rhizobium sp. 2YAF20 TaxID=3233027 RepID=UPI003F9AAA12